MYTPKATFRDAKVNSYYPNPLYYEAVPYDSQNIPQRVLSILRMRSMIEPVAVSVRLATISYDELPILTHPTPSQREGGKGVGFALLFIQDLGAFALGDEGRVRVKFPLDVRIGEIDGLPTFCRQVSGLDQPGDLKAVLPV